MEQAKQKTAEAVSTTVTITQATTPMDENVRLWSQNLQDFQHDSAAYDSAVHSAGDAGTATRVLPFCSIEMEGILCSIMLYKLFAFSLLIILQNFIYRKIL